MLKKFLNRLSVVRDHSRTGYRLYVNSLDVSYRLSVVCEPPWTVDRLHVNFPDPGIGCMWTTLNRLSVVCEYLWTGYRLYVNTSEPVIGCMWTPIVRHRLYVNSPEPVIGCMWTFLNRLSVVCDFSWTAVIGCMWIPLNRLSVVCEYSWTGYRLYVNTILS